MSADAFKSVVKEGTLKLRGMPPAPMLSDSELDDLRHYLRMRAIQVPVKRRHLNLETEVGRKAHPWCRRYRAGKAALIAVNPRTKGDKVGESHHPTFVFPIC